MDWNDLRYVLAVARTGSALRAGEQLGVNHTTVLRRLEALEARLGAPLFEKGRNGRSLTEAGRCAVEAAEGMEREAEGLLNALAAQARAIGGSIRLTTSDSLANRLVTPCLRAFKDRHPDISVQVIAADEPLDIARGEADVALRAGFEPEGAGIVARRLPDTGWTLYGSAAYVAERGTPSSRADLAGHDIVGLEGRMATLAASRWLAEAVNDSQVRFRSNSLLNLISNLKAGLGLGILPALFGDAEPDLVRCFEPPAELTAQMWLIVREDIRRQPHVRAFTDFLADYVRREMTAAPADA